MIFILLSLFVIPAKIFSTTEVNKEIVENMCSEPGEEYRICNSACEETCAAFQSPECDMNCISGCFCKKGFVRDGETSVRPKCIKTSECPKKECPDHRCIRWKTSEKLWGNEWLLGCDEEELNYRVSCNGNYSPEMPRETVLYHMWDLDDDDASAIRSVMDHIENTTCVKWRQLARCCIANDPNNGRPLQNYLNISDSEWCWLNANSGEDSCTEVLFRNTPASWKEDMILDMFMQSLGLNSDKNFTITINLDITINDQEDVFAPEKPPYDNESDSYNNSLISVTIGGNSSISKFQKINDLFKCPSDEVVL